MKKLILIVAILALFAGSAQAISWPFDLPASHNSDLKEDSITFLTGVDAATDTSAIYEIGNAGSLSMMLRWAGTHATDSATFGLVFQVSNSGDTNYFNWKTVGSTVACSTVIGGGSPVGVGIKVAYLPPDSTGIAAGAGGAVTSALKAAIGSRYIRWIIMQRQENTTNDDSSWIASKLLIRE
jgi:hypothetical protein